MSKIIYSYLVVPIFDTEQIYAEFLPCDLWFHAWIIVGWPASCEKMNRYCNFKQIDENSAEFPGPYIFFRARRKQEFIYRWPESTLFSISYWSDVGIIILSPLNKMSFSLVISSRKLKYGFVYGLISCLLPGHPFESTVFSSCNIWSLSVTSHIRAKWFSFIGL